MLNVLGIDPSSKKLAFCLTPVTHDKIFTLSTISLPAGALQATGAAYRGAFSFFERNKEGLHVYMEAPVVGRSIGPTIIQAQVGGAVMAAAQNAGVPLHLVNNMTWKKRVLGKGNASKPEVADLLRGIWPEAYAASSGDQDLIDACAINRYGVRNRRLAKAILTRSSSARETQSKKEGGRRAAA
jgi:Holliday junction resolvasome RuvABC endonuclease subunit